MANSQIVAAVGESLRRFLNQCFIDDAPVEEATTRAYVARTEDMSQSTRISDMSPPMLTMFLYRIDVNRTVRPAWSAVAHQEGRVHLPLDLHYLMTAWASNAEYEQNILGNVMQCLERTPIFSGPLLYPTASWQAHEAIQISLQEITTEDLMRTFDSLPVDYKLSIPYMVRVARIEAADSTDNIPVTGLVRRVGASVAPANPGQSPYE